MNLIVKEFNQLSNTQLYEILKSRSEVFLLGQGIVCQDMDDVDYKSNHCFFERNGRVVAYLRFFWLDKNTICIGRVCTLEQRNGLGTLLMSKSIEFIKNNTSCCKIVLHSQKQAQGFYEKIGFVKASDEFMEEGIVHLLMEFYIKN